MCGRFQMTREAFFALRKTADIPSFIQQELPLGMIYPSQPALILDNDPGTITGAIKKFGIEMELGGKKKRLINARAETVLEKWTFRESILKRRCVIPAAWFYEWDAQKQMISFFEEDQPVLYMAGFYKEDGFIILTTDANASMAPYHHRMPLLLRSDQLQPWLLDQNAFRQILHARPDSLCHRFVNQQPSLF